METIARTHRELTADDIFRRPAATVLDREAATVGDVALQAMHRIDDLERERDIYREMLQIALGCISTLTDTCRRQRDRNKELVIALEISRREAEDTHES